MGDAEARLIDALTAAEQVDPDEFAQRIGFADADEMMRFLEENLASPRHKVEFVKEIASGAAIIEATIAAAMEIGYWLAKNEETRDAFERTLQEIDALNINDG